MRYVLFRQTNNLHCSECHKLHCPTGSTPGQHHATRTHRYSDHMLQDTTRRQISFTTPHMPKGSGERGDHFTLTCRVSPISSVRMEHLWQTKAPTSLVAKWRQHCRFMHYRLYKSHHQWRPKNVRVGKRLNHARERGLLPFMSRADSNKRFTCNEYDSTYSVLRTAC